MDIDIVVLWVDGNDPDWQREKDKYSAESEGGDTISVNRFRDWGLMKYWFRAIEQNLPWVRKIHFVTCGQVPDFLNLEHPKLHFVKHSDYMPAETLPTFNSCAIEMNIHKIEGLAEHFIFFNDDIFVLKQMNKTDFFQKGLPCVFGGEKPLVPVGATECGIHTAINDVSLINAHTIKKEAVRNYGRNYINRCYSIKDNFRTKLCEIISPNAFLGFYCVHGVSSYLKSSFEEIWEIEPRLLMQTSMTKFRSKSDVNQWAVLWWQVATGKFAPYRPDVYNSLVTGRTVDKICSIIKGKAHDIICINDPNWEIDFEACSEKVQEAFSVILPEKCSFEV